jgi:Type VI secretion system (T6SS), amidase effector protein 4
MKPPWSRFWLEYPDYRTNPDSAAVKKNIGGHVDEAWLTNTCAIRMSRGLNYSGVLVPANFAGLATVAGGDKKRYAFRVAEMRPWLRHEFGKPDFEQTKKSGTDFDKSALTDQKGIIAFDIHFSDATGHLDAWDGTVFSHEYAAKDYWTRATRISLWSLS